MKKTLLPLAAVIVAIAASAFSPKAKQTTQALFWYDAETLQPLNGGVATETIPSQCDRTNTTACAYGFASQQSNPNPANADDTVFKP